MDNAKELRKSLFNKLRGKITLAYLFIFLMLMGMLSIVFFLFQTDSGSKMTLIISGLIISAAFLKFVRILATLWGEKPVISNIGTVLSLSSIGFGETMDYGGAYHFGKHHQVVIQDKRGIQQIVFVATNFYDQMKKGDVVSVILYDDKVFAMPYVEGDNTL